MQHIWHNAKLAGHQGSVTELIAVRKPESRKRYTKWTNSAEEERKYRGLLRIHFYSVRLQIIKR